MPAAALRTPREVYWTELRRRASTPVYDGELLLVGNRIDGPALIETTDTTVVLRPQQSLMVDRLGNFAIDPGPPPGGPTQASADGAQR